MVEPRQDDHTTGRARWLPFALAALFVACQLPVISSLLFYHSDERHYIEAAQLMRDRGDWLTPATRHETVRLRKPIATYWTVLGGQAVFGVNPLGLRIGFLLAGGALIVLTATLARRVGCDQTTSLIAAMVLLGHVQLSLSATRAIPDVLQCLFLLVSAIGAVELLLHPRPRRAAAWWLWVGAGLAVATKGLLAMVFLIYLAAWLIKTRRGDGVWRTALHPPAVVAGLVLALWWYVAMMIVHGDLLWEQFFSDQVTAPIASRWIRPAYQIPLLLGAFAVIFLPWTLAFGTALFKRTPFAAASANEKRFARFALGWACVLAVIFGMGVHLTLRYIFVASPLIAVVVAGGLARFDAAQRDAVLRRVGLLLAMSLSVLAVAAVAANAQLGLWSNAAGVVVVYGVVVGCVLIQRRAGALSATFGLAAIVLLIMPLMQNSVVWLRLPYPGRVVAHTLPTLPRVDTARLVCVGDLRLPSRIALYTGGRVFPDFVSPRDAHKVDREAVLILDDPDRRAVDVDRYDWHRAGSRIVDVDGPDAVMALFRGDLARFVADHRHPIWIATPKHTD